MKYKHEVIEDYFILQIRVRRGLRAVQPMAKRPDSRRRVRGAQSKGT